MNNNIDYIVEDLVENYKKTPSTAKINGMTQPNREEIKGIISNLQKLTFPGYFEQKHLKEETISYHVGNLVEDIHYNLRKQIIKASLCCGRQTEICEEKREMEANKICLKFLESISSVREVLATDVQAAYDGDPAAYSMDEIIYSYPGLYAIMVYRYAHELYKLEVPLIPRIMTEHAHGRTGIDIHPGATIGRYFFIDHGTGIVIGETTIIGEHVKVYQGVTLGGLSTSAGQLLKGVKRHPTIEDNVTIYAGASILGGESVIGHDVTIGSNAFVTKSVPANSRVVSRNNGTKYHSDAESSDRN